MSVLRKTALTVGLLASSVFGAATVAPAAEITLQEKGSTFVLSGELKEFDGTKYVIESVFGPVTVSTAEFDCIEGACPTGASDAGTVWQVSLWGKRRAFTEHIERIAELVEAKTGGDFMLDLHYGDLSPSKENLDGISQGKFEMAQFCASYHPEKNPSITVLELPFLGVTSLRQEMLLSQALYRHPAVVAEMDKWNATILMPSPQPQNNIIGVGTPPISLAGFGNLTVRAPGGIGRALTALGSDFVQIPAPQVKDALTDGTVNAVAMAPHAHMAFGTLEAGLWWTTNLNPGTSNCPVVVGNQALEDLSAAHRVALLSSVDEALEHYIANYEGVTMAAWGPALEERGIIQITVNEEIIDAINAEVAGPAAAEWIQTNSNRGVPAAEIYGLVRGLIDGNS